MFGMVWEGLSSSVWFGRFWVLLRPVGAGWVVLALVASGMGWGSVATAQELGADDAGVHQPAVDALGADGVFEGTECGDGGFCPMDAVERWVMAVWLTRVLDDTEPGPVSSSRFADVGTSEWWAPYVERIAELGVTQGCATEPARFCPDEPVTRAQMASFLVRAFGLDTDIVSRGFADTVGSVHAATIDALAAAGVTAGCARDPLRYCPYGSTTRAQMATFLARASGRIRIPDTGRDTAAPFVTVKVGNGYACALRADGSSVCWGKSVPGEEVIHDEKFIAVDLNDHVGCGVRVGGTIVCWPDGEAFWWDKGGGYPWVRVEPPAGEFTDVAATWANHGTFACGIRTDRTVACWGARSGTTGGNIGKVEFPERPPGRYIDIAADKGRFCGVRADQGITCWGTHDNMEPWDVPEGRYSSVDVGDLSACGLRADQTIVCWGKADGFNSPVTTWTPTTGHYSTVSAGSSTWCGIRTDETVHCWFVRSGIVYSLPSETRGGWTDYEYPCGILTDGTLHCRPSRWGLHLTPGGGPFTDIAGHRDLACALRADRSSLCWGPLASGGFELDGYDSAAAVRLVGACLLRADQTVTCWRGNPDWGEADVEVPDGRFEKISGGWIHTCGLRVDGTAACWGSNDAGQLDTPQGRFVDVAAGGSVFPDPDGSGGRRSPSGFSCGVRTDNSIVCWGSPAGALDPPDGQYTQVTAGSLSIFGPANACALRVDKSITCWSGGLNWTQPVTVAGPFKTLDKKGRPCGLRTDNTLVCWYGYYESGNLEVETVAKNVVAFAGGPYGFYVDTDGNIRQIYTGARLFVP